MMLCRSCGGAWLVCSDANRGGTELLASGLPPAIEVSGTPVLRGGGGGGCSDEGWYAVAVCICRLDDWRKNADEAKVRVHCGHLRGAEAAAANRWVADAERTNAPVVRDRDIIVEETCRSYCDGEWSDMCDMIVNGEVRVSVTKFAEAMSSAANPGSAHC
jgi:hypothetical protein